MEGLSAVVAAFRCSFEGGEGSRFGVVFDRPRSLGVIVTGLAAARYRLPPSRFSRVGLFGGGGGNDGGGGGGLRDGGAAPISTWASAGRGVYTKVREPLLLPLELTKRRLLACDGLTPIPCRALRPLVRQ